MDTVVSVPCPENLVVPSETEEKQIAALLQCRFGDGLTYLPRSLAKLQEIAVRFGFMDNDGYLTRRGRSLMAKHDFA